jgi:lipopolysaccharide transport system permease protein
MKTPNTLQVLSRHIDYILYKTWADLRAEARRYYMSYLWWVLGPVLEMIVFYVVFSLLLRRGTADFVPFLLIGLITFKWFGTTCSRCAKSILKNRNLTQQVHIPKIIFPLVEVCTSTFQFIIAFALIVGFVNIYGLTATWAYLALPVVLATQLLLIVALGMMLSAFVPFFPDFELILGYIIRMIFFLSGIFYDPSQIAGPYQDLFFHNPMARIIHEYRAILMHGELPSFAPLSVIALFSGLAIILTARVMHRLDRTYPRILAR